MGKACPAPHPTGRLLLWQMGKQNYHLCLAVRQEDAAESQHQECVSATSHIPGTGGEFDAPPLSLKPAGAVVLFDGKTPDNFKGGRMTEDGLLMEGVTSKQTFQSFKLHVEFRTPFMPKARGQGRGTQRGCCQESRTQERDSQKGRGQEFSTPRRGQRVKLATFYCLSRCSIKGAAIKIQISNLSNLNFPEK